MANRMVKKPVGTSFDILTKVDNFILLSDIIIFDCKVDFDMPIILERSFMAKAISMVYMEKGDLKCSVNDFEVTINIDKTMNHPIDMRMVSVIDCVDNTGGFFFGYYEF